jgi:hydrogenase expression/formation protein HypC
MCLAVPGRIISVQDDTARVDVNGVMTDVNITLLDEVSVGDYVIVHAGFAIQRYDRQDAEDTLKLFKELEALDGLQ